jgi:hypothetical protein
LSARQQLVQSVHAAIQAATLFPSQDPWLVVCQVPDAVELGRAKAHLETSSIDAAMFYEPDDDLGFTAIATGPIGREQRRALRRYQLWSE